MAFKIDVDRYEPTTRRWVLEHQLVMGWIWAVAGAVALIAAGFVAACTGADLRACDATTLVGLVGCVAVGGLVTARGVLQIQATHAALAPLPRAQLRRG